ncbi:hypothetical protein B0H12DRAFT_152135 [Mycena haematopus]|nr:hypothetical protein B0H12DRAFT_152135 [Mycena haematopus]
MFTGDTHPAPLTLLAWSSSRWPRRLSYALSLSFLAAAASSFSLGLRIAHPRSLSRARKIHLRLRAARPSCRMDHPHQVLAISSVCPDPLPLSPLLSMSIHPIHLPSQSKPLHSHPNPNLRQKKLQRERESTRHEGPGEGDDRDGDGV